MFSRPQKSVVHGRWCVSPKPPWFASTRAAVPICRRITRFEAAPSWGKLPGVIVAALRG
jgi:aldehyde dehydrogenase (NAD(P)+)